jgi:predicted RNA methylase
MQLMPLHTGDWNVTMDVQVVRALDVTSQRADCVISELLDTQLIGEGLLRTLRHAADVRGVYEFECS